MRSSLYEPRKEKKKNACILHRVHLHNPIDPFTTETLYNNRMNRAI